MNVWTNEEGVVITAELPGVNPDDIDITVNGDALTLSGNRAPDALEAESKYHRRERRSGRFSRTVQLPFAVEADQVDALFEKGIWCARETIAGP
jgi:HSP20 family protein